MATEITILKTVLRNTTLTVDLTLDFATTTIDLAREQKRRWERLCAWEQNLV